jgi:hypothetical protein
LRKKNHFFWCFYSRKVKFSLKDETLKEWDVIFQENEINNAILWHWRKKRENDSVFPKSDLSSINDFPEILFSC